MSLTYINICFVNIPYIKYLYLGSKINRKTVLNVFQYFKLILLIVHNNNVLGSMKCNS